MSDRILQALSVDPEPRPTDWHSVAPTLGLRSLVGIALVVPLLLAAGVYWLHHVPAGTGVRTTDAAIEVRLITPEERTTPRQHSSGPPSEAALNPQSQPLVEDPNRSIPSDAMVPAQPEPGHSSPSAGTSTPTASAATVRVSANQIAIFQASLLSHIARYRRYPDDARHDRLQGIVQAVFAMRRDGTVTDVWIKSSSGHKALDLAAIDTIRRAQPLPKIPAGLPDQLNILMPVAFALP